MAQYQIFTDSSSDLTPELRKQYNLEYFYFGLVVDGVEKRADLDWKDYSVEDFYGWLKQGKKVKTTQVSLEEVLNKVRPYFVKGIDIIYFACSCKLTGSMNLFMLAREQLLEEFPERKMIGVETLTASMALGIFAMDAAKKQQEGLSIEELEKWALERRYFYNFFATVDTLSYLRASGRIKGTAAFFGNIIGVKPIFISARDGNNLTIEKVKGTKASLNAIFEGAKSVMTEDTDVIYIGQGDCMERALGLKQRVEDELKVRCEIIPIGPIVGTSCGPGIIATFLRGKEVTRFEGDGK